MKVYVIIEKVDYEGEEIKAIFSTKDAADKYAAKLTKKLAKPILDISYPVYTFIVDDPTLEA